MNVSISQTDPKANYLAHKVGIDQAISRVLESGWYILGQEVTAFETEFAAYIGVKHGVGVANGTDALEIALRAYDIGPGDAVFTVSHTAVATVAAIELVGATPIFVDVDPVTYTMAPNSLENAIRVVTAEASMSRLRPRAILPVHLYGHPANLSDILDLAQRYDLPIIEDCSQAHGAAVNNLKVGCWGQLAVFSLYPTKNLGALGDGGIIISDDDILAPKIRSLREYGWRERYISAIPGLNSRLDELQAAILRVKLQYLDEENGRRAQLAQLYTDKLANTKLQLPETKSNTKHVFHQYVIRTNKRDELRTYLRQQGIGTLIHYPIPVHMQPAYQQRIPIVVDLSKTEEIAKQVLSLPIYPELRHDQVEIVCQHIKNWCNS